MMDVAIFLVMLFEMTTVFFLSNPKFSGTEKWLKRPGRVVFKKPLLEGLIFFDTVRLRGMSSLFRKFC